MLLKDKYKPKLLEELNYYSCYNILYSLKDKPNFSIILQGKNNIGKTLILNILKKTFDPKIIVSEIDNYTTKNNILLIDDLDLLSDKEQFKIKKYLELGGKFIATINNSHKIIKDIMLRSIVIELNINNLYYKNHLTYIMQKENILLHNITVDEILIQSNYNIAIAINHIQKLSIVKIDYDTNINNMLWDKYYNLCLKKDTKSLQEILNNIIEKEYSFLDVIHSFLNYIKFQKHLDDSIKYKIIKIILYYIQIYYTLQNNTILLYIFTNKLINLL